MNERSIKRLLLTLVMAIIVIMIAKFLMIKAATNLGNAANEKKQSAASQQAPAPATDTPVSEANDLQAASAIPEAGLAASSVEATAQ